MTTNSPAQLGARLAAMPAGLALPVGIFALLALMVLPIPALLLDIFFSVVFLAVMLYYSVWLTLIVVLSLPCYVLISVLIAVGVARPRASGQVMTTTVMA